MMSVLRAMVAVITGKSYLTASEIIYERANAEKPFMGLTSFSGELPALKDIGIAKNYLLESELKILNNLVSGYFDLAEINAIEHKPMYMNDYVKQLDLVLSSGNRKLLVGSGSVSHKQAIDKAKGSTAGGKAGGMEGRQGLRPPGRFLRFL